MSQEQVMIHVRFSPAGAVTEISQRPAAATPQGWFDHLTAKAGESFQPLSGGRGVFRVPSGDVESFKGSYSAA